jgi:hypothetical protein
MAEASGDSTPATSKLEQLNKEELLKVCKKYAILHRQLKLRNEELIAAAATANSKDEQISQENGQLRQELENLRKRLEDTNIFLPQQLEQAKREIELNKSMLDMLNNEIQLLNEEKKQLEKRLFGLTRSNIPPGTIIEEDEEDLEEERKSDILVIDNNDCQNINSVCNEDAIKLTANKTYSFSGEFLLKKQLEDMTFHADELKSELDTEREKHNENELQACKLKLEDFNKQNSSLLLEVNEMKKQSERLTKKHSEFLLSIKQVDAFEKELSSLSNQDIALINSFIKLIIALLIDNDNYDEFKNALNNENLCELESVKVMMTKLKEKNQSLREERQRVNYMEETLEKCIKQLKEESAIIEVNSKQKQFELEEEKSQVRLANDFKLKVKKLKPNHHSNQLVSFFFF